MNAADWELMETDNDTQVYANISFSENTDLPEASPDGNAFIIVASIPDETGSVQGTLATSHSGASTSVTLYQGDDGLFRSGLICPVQSSATSPSFDPNYLNSVPIQTIDVDSSIDEFLEFNASVKSTNVKATRELVGPAYLGCHLGGYDHCLALLKIMGRNTKLNFRPIPDLHVSGADAGNWADYDIIYVFSHGAAGGIYVSANECEDPVPFDNCPDINDTDHLLVPNEIENGSDPRFVFFNACQSGEGENAAGAMAVNQYVTPFNVTSAEIEDYFLGWSNIVPQIWADDYARRLFTKFGDFKQPSMLQSCIGASRSGNIYYWRLWIDPQTALDYSS